MSRVAGHRLLDGCRRGGQLLGRAELHELRAGLGRRRVTRWHVEGLAGLDGLLVIAVTDRQSTLEHVPPVRTWAIPARECGQHGREVVALTNRDEVDGVVADVIVSVFGVTEVIDERRTLLGDFGHDEGPFLQWAVLADRSDATVPPWPIGPGEIATPAIAGRTKGGALGNSVCSSAVTWKPAASIVSSVGRLQSQHTTARFSQFMRSCFFAAAASPARTCSKKRNRPPERSTRLISRTARSWSSTPHSTSVETTTSKVASSKGRSSAGARSTIAVGATASARRSRRLSMKTSG